MVIKNLGHSGAFWRYSAGGLDALRLDTAIYLDRDFLPEVQDCLGLKTVQICGISTPLGLWKGHFWGIDSAQGLLFGPRIVAALLILLCVLVSLQERLREGHF